MAKDKIAYTDGWKYQLSGDYTVETGIIPSLNITSEYIDLDGNGTMTIRHGYAWDGPSGPAVDTKNFMRGSLVHDAFYQLIREKHLTKDYKDKADRLLQKMCEEDGMWKIRAWWVYQGVANFADDAVTKKGIHKVYHAP
jgi:hypothetical protein